MPSALLIAIDVALFMLQLRLGGIAVASQHGGAVLVAAAAGVPLTSSDVARLPIPVLVRRFAPGEHFHIALIALAFAQAAVAYALWRQLPHILARPVLRLCAGAAVLAMLLAALSAATMSSFDAYAYVGYAQLGFAHAYAPQAAALPPALHAISAIWGRPMTPLYYGPLWLGCEWLAVQGSHTLREALTATRVLGAISLAALVYAMHLAQLPARAMWLLVLNPAILTLYVANAHNDLMAVALLVAASAFAASAPVIACAFVIGGALVKLSMLPLALAVFAGPGNLARRIAFVAACAATVLALHLVWGGADAAQQISSHALGIARHHLSAATLLRDGAAVAGYLMLLLVFWNGTILASGAWSLALLTDLVYPWYAAWALPYAACSQTLLAGFLVSLPIGAALLDGSYGNLHLQTAATAAIFIAAVAGLIRYFAAAVSISVTRLSA